MHKKAWSSALHANHVCCQNCHQANVMNLWEERTEILLYEWYDRNRAGFYTHGLLGEPRVREVGKGKCNPSSNPD